MKNYIKYGPDEDKLFSFLKWNSYLSSRHKLFYVGTPKAACTSLKWWFASIEGYTNILRNSSGSSESDPDLTIHQLFSRVAPEVTGLEFVDLEKALNAEDIYRFAVVRNPYKRIFSAWQSKLLLREPLQIGPYKDQAFFNRPFETWDDIAAGFEAFLVHLVNNEAPSYWDIHWCPQAKLLRPDFVSYNRISQLENCEELVSDLEGWLGKGVPSPFLARRANESIIPYQREFLTAISVNLMQQLYAEDFDSFQYAVDPPETSVPFSREQLEVALLGVEALRKRHKRMGDQLEETQRLYVTVKQRDDEIQSLQVSERNLGSEVQTLLQKIGLQNTQLEEITAALRSEQLELSSAKAEAKESHKRSLEYERELQESQAERASLRAKISQLIETHSAELEALQGTIQESQTERASLRAEIKASQEERTKILKTANLYNSENETYRLENSDLRLQIYNLRKALPANKKMGIYEHVKSFFAYNSIKRDCIAIKKSVFFDGEFYLSKNPDVASSSMDPALHYTLYGWREGRDPSSIFSTSGYINAYPDVAKADVNPLIHYIRHGLKENRGTGKDLVEDNKTLAAELELINNSKLFDPEYYIRQNPDVNLSNRNPAIHYLCFGWREGRDPSADFSTQGYLDTYPDVLYGSINPLVHYLRCGVRENRGTGKSFAAKGADISAEVNVLKDSELFDPDFYLERYPDVAASKIDPAVHYLVFGWKEGRDPSAGFHAASYLARNPDVASAAINPLIHFLRCGRYENREATSIASFESNLVASRPVKTGPKVVFVVHDMNIGGAPVLLANIARWFQNSTNYDVRIVAMTGGPLSVVLEKIAPLYVVGTWHIADSAVGDLKRKLYEFIGDEPAFTFLNSVASGGYARINPYSTPVFSYIHEMPAILDMFQDQLSDIINHSDHIFCGGDRVYDHFHLNKNIDANNLTNVPAFVDEPKDSRLVNAAEKSKIRQEMGISNASRLVVGCGVAHWRKQPEVFVRMAVDIVLKRGHDAHFIWVGDGEDIPELVRLARELGVDHIVNFVGHKENFRDYLEAADIFALPSLEDPFPLVCLEAGLVGTPSVVFREATGMTAMIEPEGEPLAGLAVPLGDEQAFFDAIDQLLVDEDMRTRMSIVARDRIRLLYSLETGCSRILYTIRRIAKLRPMVSVVVPTYNSGPYLKQRLSSIGAQTFKDIEILLLDDASTDDSVEIISEFAKSNIFAKIYLSDSNSGSVFKAWNRGIDLAEGELIWVAEADDWCEADFLHTAISVFSQTGVRLVHGRSIPVTSEGEIAGDWNQLYLNRISPGRWTRSFVAPSFKEVNATLGRANTIPNASAVVVRRESAKRAIRIATQFKLAGDWAFYLTAIAGGKIAYCHEAVNFHRRHGASVTSGIEGKEAYFQELQTVGALVEHIYGENLERRAAFEEHLSQEVKRFGWNKKLPEAICPEGIAGYNHPGVIYGVGDLSAGGAQMFAVRFVNCWTKRLGRAVLFIAEHEQNNLSTIKALSPEVAVVTAREVEAAGGLENFMNDWGLNLAMSGHWWGDRAISKMIESSKSKIPWIIVMHGCYENVLGNKKMFPTADDDFRRAEKYCDHWVWTAEKNKIVFRNGHINPKATSHIVNGFSPVYDFRLKRSDLNISDESLVFTIASRAIESKGWGASLSAFEILKEKYSADADIHLLMIGDGPESEAIRLQPPISGVHLINHTSRLADFINISDVCLLPSWFPGESLPLVLLEFLAQGKPAIVSDIGMCPWAIGEGTLEPPAGFVVPRGASGRVAYEALASAMEKFIIDPRLRETLRPTALEAFKKFDMDQMIAAYQELSATVVQSDGVLPVSPDKSARSC